MQTGTEVYKYPQQVSSSLHVHMDCINDTKSFPKASKNKRAATLSLVLGFILLAFCGYKQSDLDKRAVLSTRPIKL